METVIRLEHVDLTFRRDGQATQVLHDFSLSVAAGQFVAIIGPSGVGKSTLLRVVAGLLAPSAGRVTVPARRPDQPLPVALVFQDARLLPWRRIGSNVSFGLEHGSISRAERQRKAEAALELVGLAGYAGRFPHELSGGQRQRVALARALAVDPDVLLMDEPFAALDAITRETLQDELARIHRATGKTVLFVTHAIEEAVYLADEVVTIGGTPGRNVGSIAIDVPRPRRRNSAELAIIEAQLRGGLGASWSI